MLPDGARTKPTMDASRAHDGTKDYNSLLMYVLLFVTLRLDLHIVRRVEKHVQRLSDSRAGQDVCQRRPGPHVVWRVDKHTQLLSDPQVSENVRQRLSHRRCSLYLGIPESEDTHGLDLHTRSFWMAGRSILLTGDSFSAGRLHIDSVA